MVEKSAFPVLLPLPILILQCLIENMLWDYSNSLLRENKLYTVNFWLWINKNLMLLRYRCMEATQIDLTRFGFYDGEDF